MKKIFVSDDDSNNSNKSDCSSILVPETQKPNFPSTNEPIFDTPNDYECNISAHSSDSDIIIVPDSQGFCEDGAQICIGDPMYKDSGGSDSSHSESQHITANNSNENIMNTVNNRINEINEIKKINPCNSQGNIISDRVDNIGTTLITRNDDDILQLHISDDSINSLNDPSSPTHNK